MWLRSRRAPFLLAASLLGFIASSTVARPAEATIVERVVAVVGERAILLSDLRQRAQPLLLQIYSRERSQARRAAATSQMYTALLEKMVDEELMRIAANKARLNVTAREVDNAIERISRQAGISVDKLVAEAAAAGLNENDYREEIRRQLLEAKLLNLRVQGRVRVTEEDMRSTYRDIVLQERRKLAFRAAWIRLDVPPVEDREARRKVRERAENIAERAAEGADFAALARRHSDDPHTRDRGGLLGRMRVQQLPPALRKAIVQLEVGRVSAPIRDRGSWVVIRLIEREASELPTLEEARPELRNRVYTEKMVKARQHWLDGLRRRTHIDVRL